MTNRGLARSRLETPRHSASSSDGPRRVVPMGRLPATECAAKGCALLRGSLSDGVEVDLSEVIAQPSQAHVPPTTKSSQWTLWACCHAHAQKIRVEVLGELTAEAHKRRGRGEAGGHHDPRRFTTAGAALRELLRMTTSEGQPQNELLWRLVAIVNPELLPRLAQLGGEDEDPEADGDGEMPAGLA